MAVYGFLPVEYDDRVSGCQVESQSACGLERREAEKKRKEKETRKLVKKFFFFYSLLILSYLNYSIYFNLI